ncbi:MAG: site-specific integrase [Flavobacteriia bacterium]|nr:site-specific integrase [Flavobacteriia bacterium]
MTVKVTLRQKAISKGRKSLYLDFYPAIPHPKTGEPTRREFLGLYIVDKPKSPIDKRGNAETLEIAKSIRQKRENILNKPEIYTEFEKERLRQREMAEMDFIQYFEELKDKRGYSNRDNWNAALKYLVKFSGGKLRFGDLTEKMLEDFKHFLQTTKSNKSSKTTLSQNSAVSYFNKVKAALKQAFQDGYLNSDLGSKVKPIKAEETRREFLTQEELNKLAQTHCTDPLMKRAALFSALTGMRFSDIQKMKWSEIEFIEGQGYVVKFNQQKTKGVEHHPISDQAYQLTEGTHNPSQMEQEGQVFDGLKYSAYHNKHLFQWIGAAGITKNITFHCFRHTYATLQLLNGTDIYTVSKLLGHKDLKTTQVYARVVDQLKHDSVNRIVLNFNQGNDKSHE